MDGTKPPGEFAHFLILGEGNRIMTRPWQSISASRSINFDNYETWDPRRRYIADAQFVAFESARPFPSLPEVIRLHDGIAKVIVDVVSGQSAPLAGLQELERTLQAVLDERAAGAG